MIAALVNIWQFTSLRNHSAATSALRATSLQGKGWSWSQKNNGRVLTRCSPALTSRSYKGFSTLSDQARNLKKQGIQNGYHETWLPPSGKFILTIFATKTSKAAPSHNELKRLVEYMTVHIKWIYEIQTMSNRLQIPRTSILEWKAKYSDFGGLQQFSFLGASSLATGRGTTSNTAASKTAISPTPTLSGCPHKKAAHMSTQIIGNLHQETLFYPGAFVKMCHIMT